MAMVLALAVLTLTVLGSFAAGASEDSGYVTVREGSHMFWWLIPGTVGDDAPVVMWLQGGPGASSSGFGNFMEIGPRDIDMKPRAHAWTTRAHLLFVDNPVGTGYSYVDDPSHLTRNNTQISDDLLALWGGFLAAHPEMAAAPLYVFSESYGGKMAAGFAQRLVRAISDGEVKCVFGGVALGDSWISPVDAVAEWGPYLSALSLLDDRGLIQIMNVAMDIRAKVEEGQGANATELWGHAEELVENLTDGVDFYNVLRHHSDDDVRETRAAARAAARHLRRTHPDPLAALIKHLAGLGHCRNGKLKAELGVPANVTWGGQAADTFNHLAGDFMNDVVPVVDDLLRQGVMVTVYTGQLDVICSTPGTTAWMGKLKWPKLKSFNAAPRLPIYPSPGSQDTGGFVKRKDNLAFYWILNAGHMVPADQPSIAIRMLESVLSYKPE